MFEAKIFVDTLAMEIAKLPKLFLLGLVYKSFWEGFNFQILVWNLTSNRENYNASPLGKVIFYSMLFFKVKLITNFLAKIKIKSI